MNVPRKASREVENLRGGIAGASSGCDLPRNRQQMYNLNYKKNNSQPHLSGSGVQCYDVLAQVMHMCECVGSEMFIRSVEDSPEAMCILASD